MASILWGLKFPLASYSRCTTAKISRHHAENDPQVDLHHPPLLVRNIVVVYRQIAAIARIIREPH